MAFATCVPTVLDKRRLLPGDSSHRRIFIERAYAVLARLPHPLLIGFVAIGHRIMEARHLRGTCAASSVARPRLRQAVT